MIDSEPLNVDRHVFLRTLFVQLRQRRFPLGMDDYESLRLALRAGFGLESRAELCDLCCAMWAKSSEEQATVKALFDQLAPPEWQRDVLRRRGVESAGTVAEWTADNDQQDSVAAASHDSSAPTTSRNDALPEIPDDGAEASGSTFIFVPQFPLTYREVAQAWRRLRRPLRSGPPIELDIAATVARRCRTGIASAAVLVPRRRNVSRLLLLVDRHGSMTPFHWFVDHVCAAIIGAGNLGEVATFYFHDTPTRGADRRVLDGQSEQLFPRLDGALSQIAPHADGFLFQDPALLLPQPTANVLRAYATGAAVVIISDGGAARRHYDIHRLLDTVAFLKALRLSTASYVWLNPLPRRYWRNTTATQIARYIPMFPLDRDGMHGAINVLRGHPASIERPL